MIRVCDLTPEKRQELADRVSLGIHAMILSAETISIDSNRGVIENPMAEGDRFITYELDGTATVSIDFGGLPRDSQGCHVEEPK